MQLNTKLTLAGRATDSAYNSVIVPMYQSAIFRFDEDGSDRGYDYTRSGNPTRRALEEILNELDHGAGAVALTSGMAAVSTALALFDSGSHIICSHDCYGGTERLLTFLQSQGKIDVSFVDLRDLAAVRAAIQPNTWAIWVESPSNPLLRIADIPALAALTRAHEMKLIVDNTFLSPWLQQPLALGADLAVYSTTKFINGHSDVIGGSIVARTPELYEQVQYLANCHGTAAQPFDSWLTLRGVKTLPLRLQAHEQNAMAVAQFLNGHPAVETTYYPGLPTHEGHELAARQQKGFGGIVSFAVRRDVVSALDVVRKTNIFTLAVSVGGVESLIEHPATMSHASMRSEQRAAAGITDNIIRLSVGIEAVQDLITDLDRALNSATVGRSDNANTIDRITAAGMRHIENLTGETASSVVY